MADNVSLPSDEAILPSDMEQASLPSETAGASASLRQRAFREQTRMGEPDKAAQISYAGEKLAAPMPKVEQPKTGMFLGTDEQGRMVATEQPITSGAQPEGVLERMSRAAKAGLGEEPFGISPETRAKYPWANTLQLAAYPADVVLRGLNAAMTGGAGAIAGAAEEMGMSPAMANRLQRDIYQAAQVAAVEMPKPTVGMMTKPIVRAAETGAPTVETIDIMTGEPPAPLAPTLPTVPVAEGIPIPEVRGKHNARLLPPETPHEPIALPARAGVGAEAAAGPLEGISPEAINQVARQLKADNWTPFTIDERLESMSPHQFLAEVSPNLENRAAQVAAYGGEGRNTIKRNVDQRHTEIKPRLKALYDSAFGLVENIAQERKTLTLDQKKAADEFYQKFRDTKVHPTEEIKDLLPRLEAAGAFGEAKKIAAVEGKPWEQNFFTVGERKNYPTAESWDYVKRALDSKIEESFNQFGEPTNWTRVYTQLKNELVNAIDNHPNPEVAGVWKEARDAYAGPARLKSAYELGKKVLSEGVDANELPFLTAANSPKELRAIASGIRYQLENQLGRPGAQEGRSIRQMLSENAQNKIRWIIGDEKAEKLFNAVDLENQIHGAQKRIVGGSPTAQRMLGAEEEFGARSPRAAEIAGQVAETGIGLIKEPKKTVTKAVSKFVTEKMAKAAEEKAAQLRAEIAHIYTLQGPERDAALRWILEHGENWIGAPEVSLPGVNRSTGGSVLSKMHVAKRRAEGGPTDDDVPFDEPGIKRTPEGYPYIQADEASEAQAAREAAAQRIAGGLKGSPYVPTPPSMEGKTWMMEPGLEAVQSGYAEPFFHLPEGTAVNDAGEVFNKETGEVLSITRRPNVIPLTRTPEGVQWAMPKMLELAGDVMNPLAVTRGVPVKAGEMVLGAGPVKTTPEGGVLGSMQAAKVERELPTFSVEVKPVLDSFNNSPNSFEMKEGIIGEITKAIDQSAGDVAKLPTTMGLGPMYVVNSGVEPTGKGFLLASTNNKNASKQIDGISPLIDKYPDMATNPEQWARAMTEATGNTNVVAPPYRFAKAIQDGEYENLLKSLTEGQIKDRTIGFENGKKFLTAYTSGQMDVADTGKLFMWGILSRGVDPFTHEGLFLDAFNGIEPWVRMSAEGKFTKEIAEGPYKEWAATTAPKGSGQAGSGAMHNLNAFGRDFLVKMGTPGENGITPIQRLHDLMSNPQLSGRDIRREFAKTGEGVGIDNKVVSFILLATGRDDVMVIDRIQLKNLWDDGRYTDFNIWDGISVPVVKTKDGKVKRFPPTQEGRETAKDFSQKNAGSKIENVAVTGSSLAEATYGAKGILIYEAIEDAIMKNVKDLYARAGIPGEPTPGMFHWDTWVARSNQEASHGTLGSILAKRQGIEDPLSGIYSKQGDYQTYAYGAKYAVSPSGPHYRYTLSTGEEIRLSPSQLSEVFEKVKNPKYGVVPKGFKVSESTGAPWYERKEVNRTKLDELLREAAFGQSRSVLRAFGGKISNGSRPASGGSEITKRKQRGLIYSGASILHKMMGARRGQR